jgi:uncharacterized protein YifE (UPF0438 family)
MTDPAARMSDADSDNALTDEAIATRRKQRLRQAMDDASLLIAFATESKHPTDPDPIATMVQVQSAYQQKKELTDAEEATFWNCYSALTSSILPATIEGIKSGAANKTLGFMGWMWRYPWIALPATLALIGYIVLQIFTVQGADILKQYKSTIAELEDASKQPVGDSTSGAIKTAQPPANADTNGNDQTWQPQSGDKVQLLAVEVERFQGLLAEWNSCSFYSLYLHCTAGPSRGEEEAVRAEIRLNNLNASILPMILGLLGACTQVLRSISRRVIDQSMNTIFLPAYYVRIVLGMIIGATIGLFLQPGATPGADNPLSFLTNLPLLTASFLAGYAAEIVFALLDKIVGDARAYISGSKSDGGPAQK